LVNIAPHLDVYLPRLDIRMRPSAWDHLHGAESTRKHYT
jgi:hypothetical protein